MMVKKILNVTSVISAAVMMIYFVNRLIYCGSDISRTQMPVTDLPAILVISFICAVGTVLIQDGNDETVSRRESLLRYIIHIIFLIAVVLIGGYILGWYTPGIGGILIMVISIALVYAFTFFIIYYNSKKTA
ncbi:MAG: DUF3021 family protein, partial [Oscillospiraceae bacterium]|nr:DUF3021 family protein [Oscillospiraceae bacterium]